MSTRPGSGPAPGAGAGPERSAGGTSYAEAGVDIAAADRAVSLMRRWIEKTRRPEVIGGVGGFAGLFDASALKGYRHPVLATSTDGVGTKVAIAQALDRHDTLGFDLVGMVVDDLVVCGAQPLFLTDYIACGAVVPERLERIVEGIAGACLAAGCTLIGGETAEHPGLLGPAEYDLAGAATGVVEADELLGPDRVRVGDAVLALGSSGLHSNGYALVRHVVQAAGWSLDRHVPELGRTLGEELLEPTRVYAADCLGLLAEVEVHAFAHVTGGGLAANLARVLPATATAVVRRGTWTPPAVCALVGDLGPVDLDELERTLNMGVGMLAVTPEDAAERALDYLAGRGVPAWICGEVTDGDGSVRLQGAYPSSYPTGRAR